MKTLYRSFMCTFLLALILCGAYPVLVTVIGQALFYDQATGSLVKNNEGKIIASRLIGQNFTKPEYFHGRPSAAGNGYDATQSAGSNLGPTHPKLMDTLKANVAWVLKENPGLKLGEIPVEMVTASGSGLDPHLSESAALAQADRVAGARKIQLEQVKALIAQSVRHEIWDGFGEATVNVFELNWALDQK